jgi:OmpA-OmpF porin, OOP family
LQFDYLFLHPWIKVIKSNKIIIKYNLGKKLNHMSTSLNQTLFTLVALFLLSSSFGIAQSQKEEIILAKDTTKTEVQDARPLLSSDGQSLFFGRRNHARNIGGKTDQQDIWVASLDTLGKFSKIKSLGKTINTPNANGLYSISPDGSEIIVTNDYLGNKMAPIAKSKKVNGIWKNPEPILIENYYNKSPYADFYLSYEHNVLFIAAERKGGQGDQDIYISLPGENGNWLSPVNLGVKVNSSTAEFAPFLSADGKMLFFASYREGGQGGSDIYAVQRLDESWTNWSEPKNLGAVVNTPGDENYFSLSHDLKSIYVESLVKETSKRSIYKVDMPSILNSEFLVSSK